MKAKYLVTCIYDDEITQHQDEYEVEEIKKRYIKNLAEMYVMQLEFSKELLKKGLKNE